MRVEISYQQMGRKEKQGECGRQNLTWSVCGARKKRKKRRRRRGKNRQLERGKVR